MKSTRTKFLALFLCAVLLIGGSAGVTAYAISDRRETQEEKSEAAPIEVQESDVLVKDESVYVLAGADGTVQKIIVSDWIKNAMGSTSISDLSELENIENVKGNEAYTMGGDHMRIWDAQGNDIYYQGNIEKELPVTLSVSYKLDGKTISSEKLAGQSGKVTIRFDFTNNQYETVSIDGKEEKIYVPFAMLTGMLLENDTFRNVEVSSGKLINDGSRTAIIGLAFPGLQSNLNIDTEKLTIPDHIEITADVTEFKMTNTVTIATNEVFQKLNTEKFHTTDDLDASLAQLTDAIDQLTSGSSVLYDGLCTLLEKSNELVAGIDKLTDGAAQLTDGAKSLDTGVAELAGGAQELAAGLGQLTENSDDLNKGAGQIFTSLLQMADTQLAQAGLSVPKLTIENYAQVLSNVIASLDSDKIAEKARETAQQAVRDAVNAQKDTIQAAVASAVQEEVTAKVAAAVRSNVETQVLATAGMTKEQYDASVAAGKISGEQQEQIFTAIETQMGSDAVRASIDTNVSGQMQSADIQSLIASKTEEQIAQLIQEKMDTPEIQAQITAALEKAESGTASIRTLKEQLDSYNVFYTGLGKYTSGVDGAKDGAAKLYAGAGQLKAGSAQLYTGVNELYNGILTIKNGAPALISGVTQLRDGAAKLSDGLEAFNKEGAEKLIDAVDGDLGGLLTRIKATVDVSKNYKSFSGLSDDMEGQVKFIYRTESIG